MIQELTIIVPCYNEDQEVLNRTIVELENSLKSELKQLQIIIVDDGSKQNYKCPGSEIVELIKHSTNKGYGAALKTGIKKATYSWIGITDADGTYPNHLFHELFEFTDDYDMVIGARKWEHISVLRRFPKMILTWFASFLAGIDIPDLNSGMRLFKKELAVKFWHLYPNGFSFTSTITMGAISNEFDVKYHKIEYSKRVGDSSIHPIKDTIRFFWLVTRLALYFNPKKFFVPISFIFLFLAILRGLRDYYVTGGLGGLSLILAFLSFQIFFFGILAEIINKTRIYLSRDNRL